jgi:hypothetical protein
MSIRSTAAGVALLLSALTLVPVDVTAQPARRDYLLGRPKASLSLRIGAARPSASNGVFAFAAKELTLSPSDYTALSAAAEIGVPLTQRVELQLSVATAGRRVESEYRDFIGGDDLPIEQATRLRRVPLSLGVRYNLVPAGRSVGRLAWVPTKIVPYVAAGGGAMWYRFQQEGEFVDFQSVNLNVFRAKLEAKGWAPLGYAATGFTWSLLPAVALNTELRYDHSQAPMQGDFEGFDKTAISGVGLTTGFQFRF